MPIPDIFGNILIMGIRRGSGVVQAETIGPGAILDRVPLDRVVPVTYVILLIVRRPPINNAPCSGIRSHIVVQTRIRSGRLV
jgi:hypothetical protein